jgi:hypothetical protein
MSVTPDMIREALKRELPRHHKGFVCQYTQDQILRVFDQVVSGAWRCPKCDNWYAATRETCPVDGATRS